MDLAENTGYATPDQLNSEINQIQAECTMEDLVGVGGCDDLDFKNIATSPNVYEDITSNAL